MELNRLCFQQNHVKICRFVYVTTLYTYIKTWSVYIFFFMPGVPNGIIYCYRVKANFFSFTLSFFLVRFKLLGVRNCNKKFRVRSLISVLCFLFSFSLIWPHQNAYVRPWYLSVLTKLYIYIYILVRVLGSASFDFHPDFGIWKRSVYWCVYP